jgi:hypothetical protein
MRSRPGLHLVLPLVLPGLALGGAALLLAPPPSRAFSKIGGTLDETQRDVRVHDNFLDASANDNLVPSMQFPGASGAELAVWKAIVEWGSRLHGDGSGDPLTNPLGDGGANFDALWAGNTAGDGGTNDNIVSALDDCGGGGTLAFTETPITNGWRIRFCDEWVWDDGPGTVGGRYDIQGVMAHEYGHALGLGHSSVGQATMAPSVGPGQTSLRSIHADDVAGVQCLYGVASVTKPVLVATVADAAAGTLTLHGANFAPSDNEVWFTPANPSAPGSDPIVRVTGVPSSGTRMRVAIPPGAGPGDVLVNKPGAGGATLSNAFPSDLAGTFGAPASPHPALMQASPAAIEALVPGTAETVVLTGTDLDLVTALLLDGVPVPPERYTLGDLTTITLDMPQVASLGTHTLAVSDGIAGDEVDVEVLAPLAPRYQVGTGDPLNPIDRDDGIVLLLAGTPGSIQRVYVSHSNVPSSNLRMQLDIGASFSDLVVAGTFTIPAKGWMQVVVAPQNVPDPGPAGTDYYSQTVQIRRPRTLASSNLQSIHVTQ